jgi:hypothetical protein
MAFDYRLRQTILLRFSRLTTRRLTKLGLGVNSACEQEIDKMLAVGVSRMEHQRALEKEEQLLVAEENLFRVLNDLNEQAQRLRTFPLLDGECFALMKKRMSPMWPFL